MARATLSRDRILERASDLIVERGFAATSIADIADALGTSKAGIYYHFNSKAQILEGLSSDHLAHLGRLATWAETSAASREEILGAYIDGVIAKGQLITALWSDPSARDGLDLGGFSRHCDRILDAMAPRSGSLATRVRADAALTIAQNAGRLVAEGPASARRAARDAVLAAALGALGPADTDSGSGTVGNDRPEKTNENREGASA
ncbi:TetR/AcrR family transcriptional regulator [Rathayibacter sp. CAU 1779]